MIDPDAPMILTPEEIAALQDAPGERHETPLRSAWAAVRAWAARLPERFRGVPEGECAQCAQLAESAKSWRKKADEHAEKCRAAEAREEALASKLMEARECRPVTEPDIAVATDTPLLDMPFSPSLPAGLVAAWAGHHDPHLQVPSAAEVSDARRERKAIDRILQRGHLVTGPEPDKPEPVRLTYAQVTEMQAKPVLGPIPDSMREAAKGMANPGGRPRPEARVNIPLDPIVQPGVTGQKHPAHSRPNEAWPKKREA